MASTYLKTILAALAIIALPALALAHGPQTHPSPIGEPGEPAAVSRQIDIVMNDRMRFIPASITVKPGETVRFRVRNDGIEPHEFMLGEIADLQAHAEAMRKHPEMVHDEPNAITVLPGQTGDLVWRFAKAGKVDFACLIPGHFEAGMKGAIRVSKPGVEMRRGAMRLAGAAVLGLSLLAGAPCFAQAGTAEGEVRKVDRDAGKITLRHGPVSGELEMPGMSMVFQVKDAGLLERLKPGDKVDVVIAKDQGVFYILSAEPRR